MKALKLTGAVILATGVLYAASRVSSFHAIERTRPDFTEVEAAFQLITTETSWAEASSILYEAELPFEIVFPESDGFLGGNTVPEADKD